MFAFPVIPKIHFKNWVFLLQGIASLIDDFHKRKQRLLFYKPRAAVLSVLHGVGLEDFIHVGTQEQLDQTLKGLWISYLHI